MPDKTTPAEETTSKSYFGSIERALHTAGYSQPVLVIDRERLDQNLSLLKETLAPGINVRVVSKSLPCHDLLHRVLESLDTNRVMTFNRAMLESISDAMPTVDQLLGKPLPVAGARAFYTDLKPATMPAVAWLIDTNERLGQYDALANELNVVMRVSLEIDVGLHRGGFIPDDRLLEALGTIDQSDHLQFDGFMGYEAHLAKVPAVAGLRARAAERTVQVSRTAISMAGEVFSSDVMNPVTRNSGGSLTYRLHTSDDVVNAVSIGTALLKGTDFDTDLLEHFLPAVFIATPAIKVLDEHADPWSRVHRFYGRSSNQEMLNIDAKATIGPDDLVSFRPTQTEAVLLQFGDIAVYEAGSIVETWPVYPASA